MVEEIGFFQWNEVKKNYSKQREQHEKSTIESTQLLWETISSLEWLKHESPAEVMAEIVAKEFESEEQQERDVICVFKETLQQYLD